MQVIFTNTRNEIYLKHQLITDHNRGEVLQPVSIQASTEPPMSVLTKVAGSNSDLLCRNGFECQKGIIWDFQIYR